jgi:hypothetical protein
MGVPAGKSVLHIEYPVLDYDVWKANFDQDPVGRSAAGVRRYQIHRSVDDPNHVSLDVEFETADAAQTMLAALTAVWDQAQAAGALLAAPQTRIFQTVEARDFVLPPEPEPA